MSPNSHTTQERRLMILAVIRALRRERGTAVTTDINERLTELHLQGRWPRADWHGARQDPYPVGIYQHIRAMQSRGWVHESQSGWAVMPKAPDSELRPIAELAAELLPDPTEIEERLATYERTFGMPIVIGVDSGLNRVIRYRTTDGIVEVPVEDGDWHRALTAVGA